MKVKSAKEREEELQVKKLVELFNRRGWSVRREKLSRGSSFRVKSGNCLFSGQNLVFVDRRLPVQQQLSVLIDYALELDFKIAEDELAELSKPIAALLLSQPVRAVA